MFIDESGFLMAPFARRSWAPVAATPVLRQRTRHHRKVSAIAALCVSPERARVRLCFRLRFDASVDAPMAVAFLRDLGSELGGPIVLVWDNLGMHRSKAVKAHFVSSGQWHVHRLPPYAPELNPVEGAWGYLKCNSMANFAPMEPAELLDRTLRCGRSLQRRPSLLRSFIKHSPLSLRLR